VADTEKHPIRNNVIAGVIATVIAALICYLAIFIPSVLRGCWDLCKALCGALLGTSRVPHWTLLLLAVMALPTAWRFGSSLLPRKEETQEPKLPTVWDYTEDYLFGVVWRWTYDSHNQIINLSPYCQVCDTQLVYWESFGRQVHFECEQCGVVRYDQEGSKEDALGRVTRQIARKIRNNEWKGIVNKRLDPSR
jgi:hypothetical protein